MKRNIVEASRPEGMAFFVGDIHGQYDLLMQAMKDVGFDPSKGHILFSVGDLIDRGPQNMECLKLLDEPWFFAVRGNHEDFMIRTVLENSEDAENMWAFNGGHWAGEYMNEEGADHRFTDEMIEYALKLEKTPYIREVHTNLEKQKILVVHAEIPKGFDYNSFAEGNINSPSMEKDLESLIWQRSLANQAQTRRMDVIGDNEEVVFYKPDSRHSTPPKDIQATAIISGHTPLRRPMVVGRNIFIDTAAASGRKPTIINEIEVKNLLKQYRAYEARVESHPGDLGL